MNNSMEISVLIMAAGDAIRCGSNPVAKQLFPILGKETIIGRIIRQVKEYGHDPTVVTHRPDIASVTANNFMPENRETLCNSIISSKRLWTERTIIILGDIIFTAHGMEQIFLVDKPVSVVGNEAEMYALTFHSDQQARVLESLQAASEFVDRASKGKLRYFYKHYIGAPMTGEDRENKVLTWLRDGTNDIDSMDEYETQLKFWDRKGY